MKKTSRLKKIGLGFLSVLLLLAVLPYVIPLSKASPLEKPFENSNFFQTSEPDTRIHYRVYAPENPVGYLVMIHGLGGSTFSYTENAPIFKQAGYFVVTLDLPGFGYSSRSVRENHSQVHRADLVWSLLESFGDQKWHLLGHSMGGGTVAAMALQRPEATASVIWVDGALFETNRANSRLLAFPSIERWLQVLLEHLLLSESRIEDFLTSAYGQPPTRDQVLGYLEPLQVKGTARAAGALLKTAKNVPSEALAEIKAPTLALWGLEDTWVPFSDTLKLGQLLPALEVMGIEGAGHCPMETHPQEFNTYLLGWLRDID